MINCYEFYTDTVQISLVINYRRNREIDFELRAITSSLGLILSTRTIFSRRVWPLNKILRFKKMIKLIVKKDKVIDLLKVSLSEPLSETFLSHKWRLQSFLFSGTNNIDHVISHTDDVTQFRSCDVKGVLLLEFRINMPSKIIRHHKKFEKIWTWSTWSLIHVKFSTKFIFDKSKRTLDIFSIICKITSGIKKVKVRVKNDLPEHKVPPIEFIDSK